MKRTINIRKKIFTRGNIRIRIRQLSLVSVGLIIVFNFVLTGNAQNSSSETNKEQIAEWVKVLIESPLSEKRVEAAQLLAQSGNRKAVNPLIQALNDQDKLVREHVVLALGQLRAKDAVSSLVTLLGTSTDLRLQAAAAFSLGLIRDRRAVEPLIAKLKNAADPLKTNIVVALGLLGDARAVEPLLALPHDEDHSTCAPIAIALGQIKSNVPSDKLFNWLNSGDADVCQNAAVALVLIGGKRQVIPLIQVLKNTNPVSRRSAAFALGTLKDKRAVSPLVELLSDSDTQVRLNVIEALALIKDKRAIAWLERTAEIDTETEVKVRAVEAIKKIREK